MHAAWIELPDKRTVVLTGDCRIGRVEGNEIINPDARISRRHSVVQRQGDHYFLVDLGSTNGTFLNESRIFKPTRLKDGDVILIGAERYAFCQPHESGAPDLPSGDSAVGRTAVVVGKVSCWMLLATAPENAGAWLENLRRAMIAGGAGVRPVGPTGIFAHWRDRSATRGAAQACIRGLAGQPHPAGAHLVLHYGAVRVGQAASSLEETLLGAEVTFAHKLAAEAIRLKVGFLASEAAVQSLDPVAQARPLGAQTVGDLPGTHPLFEVGAG